ncbi:hypothetical protein B0T10DRAFT_417826 [Thelonectria olida]|uniref:Uncharacterized protein n=1 Tax=Thelonectria olida TaxID=1576542 RepID=A0A9P8VQZ7_9HYPO|nr:hypothetical protein B0T10DRAFT_417826 [Thelonectria olida]
MKSSTVLALIVLITGSINNAFETVKSKFSKLNVLVNKARASFDFTVDQDSSHPGNPRTLFNKSYDVNVSSTEVITTTFPHLLLAAQSPRIVFLTSGMSTLKGSEETLVPKLIDSIPEGWPKTGIRTSVASRSSKTALNLVMLAWNHLIKGDGIKVWCVSPGFLAKGLGGNAEVLGRAGAGDPAARGELIKKVIEGEKDANVGKVVGQPGVQAW